MMGAAQSGSEGLRLPVLRALSLCACCRHSPGAATGRSPRSSHPAVTAFPDNVVGSACTSSFSRIAQRSLALRPAHSRGHLYVTSYTEGFSHFVTSMTAPVASGWSGCRVGLAAGRGSSGLRGHRGVRGGAMAWRTGARHRPRPGNSLRPRRLGAARPEPSARQRATRRRGIRRAHRRAFVPEPLVTDDLRSYSAAVRELGIECRHERGRWENNRAENSDQPTRQREREMQRFALSR